MAVRGLNKILSALTLLVALLVFIEADDVALRRDSSPVLNVSTSLEDYIAQTDRQYVAQIASYASELNNFRANYQSQVETINYNRDLVELQLTETDNKLYPLEFLNELTKHCVQRYSGLIVKTATVTSAFQSCTSQAISSLTSILSSPDSTHRSLINYYNTNWKNGLNNCATKNSASYANHTLCVIQLTSTTNTYFSNNQRTFNTQMESSRCSADTRIRQAVECVFPTVNKALGSVSEATRLIDDCIAGIELCEQCKQQSNNTVIVYEPECPNVINIITDSQTYKNATIRNPFYGMNSTMDCILVNFLKPA